MRTDFWMEKNAINGIKKKIVKSPFKIYVLMEVPESESELPSSRLAWRRALPGVLAVAEATHLLGESFCQSTTFKQTKSELKLLVLWPDPDQALVITWQ